MQTEVVLSIGGNEGDRERFLARAREALSHQVTLLKQSPIVESEVWGEIAKGGNFLNQCLLISTTLAPLDLLRLTQHIENKLGRIREQHWGNRTIDIDLLYYGDQVWNAPSLLLPHPYIAQRKFVLVPLAAMLPDWQHPITGKTSLDMLAECEDMGKVWVVEGKG
jgi:2-amino-4-hydroxy-6-hydroxymethyldihydropteridine diphosphokinase